MKAIICRKPGRPDVLELDEIVKPSVTDDGVLVRVHAASVNPVDFFPLSGVAYAARWLSGGFKAKPVVLGTDFAGTIESVGKSVTEFKPGDQVFGGKDRSTFAEYVALPATGAVVAKPANLTVEQAAAVPVAALTALQALRDHGRLRQGQKVLINGASGGVGSFAVQIAKAFGAHVTAVCSPRNLATADALGADSVIDYTREDFTRRGGSYDLLMDIAGNRSWSECKRVLAPTGILVAAGGSAHTVWGGNSTIRHLIGVRLASVGGTRKVALFIAKLNKADLLVLQALLADGKVIPVIDRCYELNRVPEAFNYMGEGHAKGKIIISV
ncbi:MAG TPA: NAD(P)-dependent alcohol dehydrogenase [Candidatus Dormibacteraeota bacterium]